VVNTQPHGIVGVIEPAALAPRSLAYDPAVDVHIDMDGAIDGRKRKRRTVGTLVFVIVVAFGGLFAALYSSYQPH
jgi:hypothetical protein